MDGLIVTIIIMLVILQKAEAERDAALAQAGQVCVSQSVTEV